MQPGKMEFRDRIRPFLVRAEILFRVRPMAGETGVKQYNRAVGNLKVSLLPRFQIGDRDPVVRVFLRTGRHIHHDRRPGELVDRELIHGLVALGEMDRRVDVRAAVLGGAIAVRRVEIAFGCLAVELGFQHEAFGRRPVKGFGGKLVCEIDPSAAGEGGVASREASERTEQEKQTRKSDQACIHVGKVYDSGGENNVRGVLAVCPLDGLNTPPAKGWSAAISASTRLEFANSSRARREAISTVGAKS